VGNAALWCRP
jgi:hypothetical protein